MWTRVRTSTGRTVIGYLRETIIFVEEGVATRAADIVRGKIKPIG